MPIWSGWIDSESCLVELNLDCDSAFPIAYAANLNFSLSKKLSERWNYDRSFLFDLKAFGLVLSVCILCAILDLCYLISGVI